MNESTNKPITVAYEEFKIVIANAINNSGLPAFLIEIILQSMLNEVKIISARQYELDKTQYEVNLENTKDEEKAE